MTKGNNFFSELNLTHAIILSLIIHALFVMKLQISNFNLKPKQRALLCLPAHYIAGKMMLVRAIVLGLELDSIEPKSNLEIDINKQYQFTAMVPMQLEKNINKLNR